jgi:NADPH-dependent 2,4-dienoyl-CoA reductase/sulfur reductase-like enzyme/rhodanese-related sulfurtransferase
MKVVIVGGVAGGASAAARLRRNDESAEIIIFERTGFISYANCGEPYYIGGVIEERSKLTVQTPKGFKERFNVDVRVKSEVTSIDRSAKQVHVKNLETGEEYDESYDKLILSPGAKATIPDVPGVDDKRIFTLRTIEDTFAISDYVEQNQPKSAAVIGGGFIGLEVAENLMERGLKVTVLHRGAHVMKGLDDGIAAVVQNRMRYIGLRVQLGVDVTGFEDKGEQLEVQMRDQKPLSADMVVLAIGVRPENDLAVACGLETGIKGAIVVDDQMRTADSDIYAVGDAVQITNSVTGKPAVVPLAGPANKQGRLVADVICGKDRHYAGAQNSFVMKMGDLTVAGTGLSYKAALAEGYDADFVVLMPAEHASYYPGAQALTLEVIYDKKDGRILGGQCAGFGGVEKRIDVLATAIKAKMTGPELTEVDLTYAPPYSSAKDPVNYAGYIIQDLMEGTYTQVHWDALDNLGENDIILDVRPTLNFNQDHLDDAIHIELDQLRDRADELPKDKNIYIHCVTGLRSYIACRMLSQMGFTCYNLAGGFNYYDAYAMDRDIALENMGPCGLQIPSMA